MFVYFDAEEDRERTQCRAGFNYGSIFLWGFLEIQLILEGGFLV